MKLLLSRRLQVVSLVIIVVAASVSGAYFAQIGPFSPPPKKEFPTVRVGVVSGLFTITGPLLFDLGILQKYGIKAQYFEFGTGPEASRAFLTGEIDVLYGGIAPAAIAIGRGGPAKIVALIAAGSHVILTTNPQVKSVEDLKGKVFAVPGFGSGSDTAMTFIFNEVYGINPKKDFVLKDLAHAEIVVALGKHLIDAGIVFEPMGARAQAELPDARILLVPPEEWMKHFQTKVPYAHSVVAVRQSLIDQYPDLVKTFVKATGEVAAWVKQNPDEALNKLSDRTKVPVDQLRVALKRTWLLGGELTDDDVSNIMIYLNLMQKYEFLKEVPTKDQLFWKPQ